MPGGSGTGRIDQCIVGKQCAGVLFHSDWEVWRVNDEQDWAKPFYLSRVSLFFSFFFNISLFLPSTVALHKHWRMLDLFKSWLQAPLASAMVDLVCRHDFGRGVHALDVFSTNSANLRVVFVVVVFSFFCHWFNLSFPFSLWWLRRIFLWV